MRKIRKILIANRGEIAIRISQTLIKLEITPVLIYSEEDKNSYFLEFADEKYALEGESLSETYLSIDQIVSIAKKSNCDAIHPGYGFLSENPKFADAVEKSGIIFIGPDSDSIFQMGNKLFARKIAEKVSVPVIPILKGETSFLIENKDKIELPFLVKAAAGGGGKGMRLISEETNLADQIISCSREALNSFGDSTVYLEKYFPKARHIEVQILGDKQGNIIHLFERECSIQRRYQKIIEETPAGRLSDKLKENLFSAAIAISKEMKYHSAGTIEFLVTDNEEFYFLEMNTRIQVEHPITEMTTGIDIVEEQIKIAEGESLSFKQEEIQQNGHAIECRIYAENPSKDFLPSPGKIYFYNQPRTNKKLRIDSSLISSGNISPSFDPMISKIISFGENRQDAINTMLDSLNEYQVLGISNNISYLKQILNHEKFLLNEITTKFCEEEADKLTFEILEKFSEDLISNAIAAVLIEIFLHSKKSQTIWEIIGRWRETNQLNFKILDEIFCADEIIYNNEKINFAFCGNQYEIKKVKIKNNKYSFRLNDIKIESQLFVFDKYIFINKMNVVEIERLDLLDEEAIFADDDFTNVEKIIYPSMPGKILDIFVKVGDNVKRGKDLIVLEAMKMETKIQSPFDCVIEKINCVEGDFVETSKPIIVLEKNEKDN